MVQSGAHRADPNLGGFGDLLVAHLMQEAQRQYLAVRCRDAVEAGVHRRGIGIVELAGVGRLGVAGRLAT